MKRITFSLGILLIFLTACTNSNLLPNKSIKEIVIKRVSDGETYRLSDKKAIKIFREALTDVEKMDGLIRIKEQEYEVVFHFENNEHKPIFLWLSKESGMAMDPSDHQVSYGLKEENVQAIHKLGWE